MDAHAELHVRTIRIDDIAALGEVHEHRTARILVEMGVVLLRQFAPQDTEAKPLAPLEFADERDAVENLSVQVPVELARQLVSGMMSNGKGTFSHSIPPLILKSILPHELSQKRLYIDASV